MTVHALVPQCALSVLSCSECKIAKIFWGFAPEPRRDGLQHPQTPQLQSGFFSSLLSRSLISRRNVKKGAFALFFSKMLCM